MRNKKIDHFYMRISMNQKDILIEMSEKRNMSMSGYIWYLIMKDHEENKNEKD